MSKIQIQASDVLTYAQQFKQKNQEIQTIFQEIWQRMHQMENDWQSPAGKTLINQFESNKAVFDAYIQALNQYVHYLEQTAYAYQENEALLSQAISS